MLTFGVDLSSLGLGDMAPMNFELRHANGENDDQSDMKQDSVKLETLLNRLKSISEQRGADKKVHSFKKKVIVSCVLEDKTPKELIKGAQSYYFLSLNERFINHIQIVLAVKFVAI